MLKVTPNLCWVTFPKFSFFFNQIKVYYLKWYYDQKIISFLGEQGWCSGESAHLPPMCPGFDSRSRRHMWVEFVVGSLLCSERFFSGYSGFPLSSKTNISKFQFELECTDISERVLVNSLVLRGWTNYIYIFISSDFESVFAKDPTGKILSFVFYPKAVYFECKFWISRSAITHVQNWPMGHQRVGSRENDVIYSLA